MSYGYGSDHSHDYASARHDHDRYDVPAISALEDQIVSVINNSRGAHEELWEYIHELHRTVADLRTKVDALTAGVTTSEVTA